MDVSSADQNLVAIQVVHIVCMSTNFPVPRILEKFDDGRIKNVLYIGKCDKLKCPNAPTPI